MVGTENRMTAVHHADFALLEVLVAHGRVHEGKPNSMESAARVVTTALEVALKAHRRGGCTSGQLRELEMCRARLQEMAA